MWWNGKKDKNQTLNLKSINMRKLFVFALLGLSIGLCAQTYCFKKEFMVDKNTGVKMKTDNSTVYITFQNNKSRCYFSDAEGITVRESNGLESIFGALTGRSYEGENYYVYQGKQDGLHVYKETATWSSYVTPNYSIGERGGYIPMYRKLEYLYFNDAFDRVNLWTDPQYYFIEGSSNESPTVKAARSGCRAGINAGSKNATSYVVVYKKVSSTGGDETIIFY